MKDFLFPYPYYSIEFPFVKGEVKNFSEKFSASFRAADFRLDAYVDGREQVVLPLSVFFQGGAVENTVEIEHGIFIPLKISGEKLRG